MVRPKAGTGRSDLLLFNNGLGNLNTMAPYSPGITRDFSTASRYTINETARTAAEVWSYNHVPPIYSSICSSVRETSTGTLLMDYASGDNITKATLAGVDAQGKVVFEFEYPPRACGTAFMAEPVALEAFRMK